MEKVLLLNASYEPLNVCSWRRALILLLKGKAEKVEDSTIEKINNKIDLPSVIKLRYYVVVPYKELPFNRKNILHRDNHTCQYCGKVSQELTIDHVIPKSKGGKSSWENVVAACCRCNSMKADKTPQEAHLKLMKKPQRPTNYLNFELSKYSKEFFDKCGKYLAG